MKKAATITLSALLAMGVFASTAGAEELNAEQKFEALVQKGIFTGFEDGNAKLDESMTRAQAATVVARLLGLEEDTTGAQTYMDLSDNHWAAGYIGAVTNAGIFNGKGDGVFDPSGTVTLEQLAAVVVRTLDIEPDHSATVDGAADWAKAYVYAALNAGLIPQQSDYSNNANRGVLVEASYGTDQLQTAVQSVREENKAGIGKLLTLGVMSAEGNRFGGENKMSKEDVLQALDVMTNGALDASELELPDTPTFADILRAYLRALGYPAASLQDADGLIDKAIAVGIIGEDSPLLRVQLLHVPLNREWGSYLTAGTLFEASTVTVDSSGDVQVEENKRLSQTMRLPSSPIRVELEDIEGVPTYDTLAGIDPSIRNRVTPIVPPVYVDVTAPIITAAEIEGQAVEITDGAYGEITIGMSQFLTKGTLTVNEAATLEITSIGSLNLTKYDISFIRDLERGENEFDLSEALGEELQELYPSGVPASLISIWGGADGLEIKGILCDIYGNEREVTLIIKVEYSESPSDPE